MRIREYGDPCLRRPATRGMTWLKWIAWGWAAELILIRMAKKARGVGLAANQVGWKCSLFVARTKEWGWRPFWDPEIVDPSERTVESEEYCLSLPHVGAIIRRSAHVTVMYKRFGPFVTIKDISYFANSTENAIIMQHEIDHLNGVVFTDHLPPMRRKEFETAWEKAHAKEGESRG